MPFTSLLSFDHRQIKLLSVLSNSWKDTQFELVYYILSLSLCTIICNIFVFTLYILSVIVYCSILSKYNNANIWQFISFILIINIQSKEEKQWQKMKMEQKQYSSINPISVQRLPSAVLCLLNGGCKSFSYYQKKALLTANFQKNYYYPCLP